jgi:hypothetical protein
MRPGGAGLRESVLDAGPDRGSGVAAVRVEYTLAGMDVLLHRLGWSVQVPARRAAERDEAAIAAWREVTWPVGKRTAADLGAWVCSRTNRPGFKAARGADLGSARPDAGGAGDRRQP